MSGTITILRVQNSNGHLPLGTRIPEIPEPYNNLKKTLLSGYLTKDEMVRNLDKTLSELFFDDFFVYSITVYKDSVIFSKNKNTVFFDKNYIIESKKISLF